MPDGPSTRIGRIGGSQEDACCREQRRCANLAVDGLQQPLNSIARWRGCRPPRIFACREVKRRVEVRGASALIVVGGALGVPGSRTGSAATVLTEEEFESAQRTVLGHQVVVVATGPRDACY
jgi:hypothetical protein